MRDGGRARALRRGAGLALSGAAMLGAGLGLAQERGAAPNPELRFDLGIGLEQDDDGAGLHTDLGATYATRTRTQDLTFSLGTAVALDGEGLNENAFLPTARLSYGFDNGDTLLKLAGSYRVRRVEGIAFVLDAGADGSEGGLDELEAVDDDGRLETLGAGIDLALNRRAPIGLELGAEVIDRNYRDTDDPDLDDTRSVSLDAALRLTPRPGLDFRLTAARSTATDAGELDSETETTTLGARVSWAATPATRVDLSLAHSEREEARNRIAIVGGALVATGGRETVTNDGLVWRGEIVQARPNGTRALRFSRTLVAGGAVARLRLARALELPGGGALELAIGAAHFEGGDTTPLLSLSYAAAPLPGDSLRVTLERMAETDGDDQEVARTRARLSYERALTPVSQLTLSAGLARVDVLDGFEPDRTTVTLGAAYTRDLTPDWALSARIDHAAARDEGGETERDSRVSLTLGRSFSFRP
ncbi:hypothetical protein [Jannaschia seohaensis]|uniref:Beta-barrel porin 2 n=1 Tax=Jannaschia seohaensis TaxID=475081 RepID=A0A2Y9B3V4_9RHOB|nr:hypothetical protein [Jannaschia seohaensis]PWJ12877.1 hypothetical protein BCF38_11513 [Jannaschia seohaensis]SSA50685.1 hypothetical protein SAMN05421539_11513 [Jannaschia seohaensis]